MFSKLFKSFIMFLLLIGFASYSVQTANAATKIMWGKTELKIGQIGKVTILSNTNLVKIASNGSLTTVRTLKKGEEYRVYSYKSNHGGLYGVGGGSFVQKNTKVKYETPSKAKLALLKAQSVPREYTAALKTAELYSDMMHMSKAGIYDQLVSEYGEKFPPAAAQYAINNLKVDWKQNALKSAQSYAELMNMSDADIYEQLTSEYGEKFTEAEAQYAIDHL
ncbi:Ltp family lipoprotein [Bacillus sp. UMB0728]|uniref:Ltp family lipoprotein n=1 Tax=Bacillus sp. UMB0728 TaxID=2066052 RepID=UPI002151FE64|nr:Ltp family lipoprotein [Bacillus sp. UMB0728]